MEQKRITVFISYSWDSEDHKEWVLKLANDLRINYGINVILDQYDLTVGKSMTSFMERSLEAADKVLIILTPGYKGKAENRKGGAGFEHSIISQDLYNLQDSNEKYLPVLRDGSGQTSAPGYIKTLIYHSMTNDDHYDSDLMKLSRVIYNKPQIVKPELGVIPDFYKIQEIDPILESFNKLQKDEKILNDRLIFLNSSGAKNLAEVTLAALFESIDDKSKKYKESTSFRFSTKHNYDKAMLYTGEGYSIRYRWETPFYNTISDAQFLVEYIKGSPSLEGNDHYFPGDEPKKIKTERYSFDVDENLSPQWKLTNSGVISKQDDIVKKSFLWLVEMIEKKRRDEMASRQKRGY